MAAAQTSTPPRAAASRLGLSRERILDAALLVLDRDGLDAFNMRRLADELGVGTMTVYGYFRGRDELLDAVIDHGAQQIRLPPLEGTWKERLRALMLSLGEAHVAHPSIVELRLKRPLLTPGALRISEAGMRILRDAGFDAADAARAYRTLFVYVFGFAAFGPAGHPEADREQTRAALAALPAEEYPALASAAPAVADVMADRSVFEFGLDGLLDGLEARLGASAPPGTE